MTSKSFAPALLLAPLALAGCAPGELAESDAPRPSRAEVFEIGQPFPTLAFPALEDGAPRSIADFKGKKVILHVFASW